MRKFSRFVAVFGLLLGGVSVASSAAALEWQHMRIADATRVVPGGDGGTFDQINRVGLEGGLVYFTALGGGGSGIYTANYLAPEGLRALYDSTTPVPGGGGSTFSGFFPVDPIMDHESIVFGAARSGGGEGIYTDAWGALAVVADTDTAVPGGTGSFTGFADPWLCDENVVFVGWGTGSKGVYLHDGVTLRVVADLSTPVPGGTGNFTNFQDGHNGKPFVEDGKVLFRARGDAQAGIYLEEEGAFTVIADLNTPIPGAEGNFFDLRWGQQLIDEDGWILFSNSGTDLGTADAGLYAYENGELGVVLDTSTEIQGTAYRLTFLRHYGIHRGREISIFGDFGPEGPANIYSTLGGVGVQPVFSVGDVVGGQEVTGFGSYGWSVEGEVIASQVFLDGEGGRAAFVSIPLASSVPLMTTPWMHLGFAALLLIGGLKAIAARRPV